MTKTIIYISCDIRYNPYLLTKFGGKETLFDWVLSRIKNIKTDSMVMNLFKCEENAALYQYVHKNYPEVEVMLSEIEDVNKRLIDFVSTLQPHLVDSYIIRTAGDAVFLNADLTNRILEEMLTEQDDWFFEQENDGTVPDIVKSSILLKYTEDILQVNRYYKALIHKADIKRKYIQYDKLPVRLQFNYPEAINLIESELLYDIDENLVGGGISKVLRSAVEQVFAPWGYLMSSGWLKTIFMSERKKLLNTIDPIPWFSYPAIYFIKQKINTQMKVYEWGCGNSTLFWQDKVQSVVSAEHNKEWVDTIYPYLKNNAEVHYMELVRGGEYCKDILKYENQFDIIVIDGRDRVRCSKNCLAALKDDGIIIWDNAEREEYLEGYDYLLSKGFKRIDFYGLLPWINTSTVTTIFYRIDNIFDI